jgi:hypothetical protein
VLRRHEVLARERPAPGVGQAPSRPVRELLGDVEPELAAVADGLLEVVAEDFVELDQLAAVLFDPAGEPFVELGAGRLREGVVGGVADEKVAEAVRVVARELGAGPAGRAPCARAR